MHGRIQIKIENYLDQKKDPNEKVKFVTEKRKFGPCNHTLLIKNRKKLLYAGVI